MGNHQIGIEALARSLHDFHMMTLLAPNIAHRPDEMPARFRVSVCFMQHDGDFAMRGQSSAEVLMRNSAVSNGFLCSCLPFNWIYTHPHSGPGFYEEEKVRSHAQNLAADRDRKQT